MAKRDKLIEKKKELDEALEQFKSEHPDLTEDELKLFEQMINDMLDEESKGVLHQIKNFICDFLSELNIMLISSLIISGFFINQLVSEQKWIIFIVAGITSLIMTIITVLPAMFTSSHRKLKQLFLFITILIFACLFNSNVYKVFEYNAVCIAYIIILEIIYSMLTLYIIKKKLASLRR